MHIIYLHGFGSSSKLSIKAKAIKEKYPEHNIYVPDIPVNAIEAINFLSSYIIRIQLSQLYKSDNKILLVGTSLGGFYADYFSRKMDLNAILINPAVDVVPIKQLVGENRELNGITYTFTEDDYRDLTWVSQWKNKLRPSIKKVDILLAKDDEMCPYKTTKLYYKASKQYVTVFNEGGHLFTNNKAIFHSISNMFYE